MKGDMTPQDFVAYSIGLSAHRCFLCVQQRRVRLNTNRLLQTTAITFGEARAHPSPLAHAHYLFVSQSESPHKRTVLIMLSWRTNFEADA